VFEEGGRYHVTTRTRGAVHRFKSEEAKETVVGAIGAYRERGRWRVHGFVVMANHVHLVLSATDEDLRATVRDFKKWVWRAFRGRGGRPLWERRYDDNAIVARQEMLRVISYIHNNPLRVGLARRATDYFWSSARNYAGLRPVAMEVDTEW
jgi:REP element-mobilizing transposase RayT